MSTNLIRSPFKPDAGVLRPSIVGPLVGIVLSESLLFFGHTSLALWGHLLTLLGCTLVPLRFEGDLPMLRAFALVPLFRLVNLGMPVFFELTLYWFPLIYGPLLPAVYLLGRSQDAVDIRIGWTALLALPLALALSWALAEIEYTILQPEQLIPAWSLPQLLLITVVMVGFVGLVEELVFRGVLQRTLETRLGRWPGLVVASAVFGLMHSGYGLPLELLFAGSIGLLFGLIYDYTDSIALVAVIHGALNVFLFAVIPFQGSLVF